MPSWTPRGSSLPGDSRRRVLRLVAWVVTTLVLLPVCTVGALLLAGPHSDLLPGVLQPVAFLACVIVLVAVPVWVARRVGRPREGRRPGAPAS